MTTALDLITEAAELAGILGSGETLSGNDADTCLRSLNNMIDAWNVERLALYTVQESTLSTASGSFTIGSGGSINVARPVKLEDDCYFRSSGQDYPLVQMSAEQYSQLAEKSLATGWPTHIYFDAQVPLATCYLWPQQTSAIELHIRYAQPLTEYATLSTDYDLPPGYRKAISCNLSVELNSGKFPRAIEPRRLQIAASSKRNIKRINRPAIRLQLPSVMVGNQSNIIQG